MPETRLRRRAPGENIIAWSWFNDDEFRVEWRRYMHDNEWARSVYWRERWTLKVNVARQQKRAAKKDHPNG